MYASEIFPFIPTKNIQSSTSFYRDVGFDVVQELEDSVRFQSGDFGFYLQQISGDLPAAPQTIQIVVQDFEAMFQHVQRLKTKYGFLALTPIKIIPTGSLFFFKGPNQETWRVILPNRRF